jgi:hypothetical protein
MQNFEYLQISINYYASTMNQSAQSENEDAIVWKGLQNYLETLDAHGWSILNESKTDKGQSRTYQFKRALEAR